LIVSFDFDFIINNDKAGTGVTWVRENINVGFNLIVPENFIEAGMHSTVLFEIPFYKKR
jgi:hypothetical protein